MKILVTGGCGFIGSNFVLKQINTTSNSILNLDKLTYAGNPENLVSIHEDQRYQFIKGDIADKTLVRQIFRDFQPDAVVHFAAESHVDRSIEGPMEFVNTNIIGTTVLLEAGLEYWERNKDTHLTVRPAPARTALSGWRTTIQSGGQESDKIKGDGFKFLHVSTDEVYGSLGEDGLFTEKTHYDPSSPYSASKAGADHLVRAWQRTYGFPALITNCSNNYGPYQFPEKLIPLMIVNCLDGKPLPVYGQGLNIRDWLYVEDHCDALYTVLQNGIIGETYNIGGHNEKRNITIVETICDILDELRPQSNGQSYRELITYVKDRPGHDLRYAIDTSKIQNESGWTPKETFETGIRKTILWYLENEAWWRRIQDGNYQQERLGLK